MNAVDRIRKSGVSKFRNEASVACEECYLIYLTQHEAALQGVRHQSCLHQVFSAVSYLQEQLQHF